MASICIEAEDCFDNDTYYWNLQMKIMKEGTKLAVVEALCMSAV